MAFKKYTSYLFCFVAGAVLMLFFQNCGSYDVDQVFFSTDLGEDPHDNFTLPNLLPLEVYVAPLQSADSPIALKSSTGFTISLENEVITADNNRVACPTDEFWDKLEASLNKIQLCKTPGVKDSAAVACTQVFTEAHSVFVYEDNDIRLGEQPNGCAPVVDVCVNVKENYMNLLTEARTSIDKWACVKTTQ